MTMYQTPLPVRHDARQCLLIRASALKAVKWVLILALFTDENWVLRSLGTCPRPVGS